MSDSTEHECQAAPQCYTLIFWCLFRPSVVFRGHVITLLQHWCFSRRYFGVSGVGFPQIGAWSTLELQSASFRFA